MHAIDGRHASICGLCICLRPCWCKCFKSPCWCLWSLPLPEAILLPVFYTAIRDHVDIHGLFYTWGTNGCLWPGLPPEAMLIYMIQAASHIMSMSIVHVHLEDILMCMVLCYLGVMVMSMTHISITHHVDVHSLYCCPSLWSMLKPRAVLVSVVSAATGDHVNVCGLCCHHRPYGNPWSLLLMAVKRARKLFFPVESMTAD